MTFQAPGDPKKGHVNRLNLSVSFFEKQLPGREAIPAVKDGAGKEVAPAIKAVDPVTVVDMEGSFSFAIPLDGANGTINVSANIKDQLTDEEKNFLYTLMNRNFLEAQASGS